MMRVALFLMTIAASIGAIALGLLATPQETEAGHEDAHLAYSTWRGSGSSGSLIGVKDA